MRILIVTMLVLASLTLVVENSFSGPGKADSKKYRTSQKQSNKNVYDRSQQKPRKSTSPKQQTRNEQQNKKVSKKVDRSSVGTSGGEQHAQKGAGGINLKVKCKDTKADKCADGSCQKRCSCYEGSAQKTYDCGCKSGCGEAKTETK